MNKLSVFILAYNQEEKIEEAVASVLWADEVIVVDSHSQDKTAEIAENLGAKVVQVDFQGFGDLRNKALAACQYEWIFSLDSDERCTPDARDEIKSVIHDPSAADVYFMPRKNIFMGRWIKYVWPYPNYRQPQLFRKGKMAYDMLPVHEGYVLHTDKPVGHLSNPIWQIPFLDFSEMFYKADRYSTLGVEKLAIKGIKPSMWRALGHGVWAFMKHYIVKRGFLDGWPGLVISLSNAEGTFYRYAKYYEQSIETIQSSERSNEAAGS